MGEHLLCTQEVIGSIPFTSTKKHLGEVKEEKFKIGQDFKEKTEAKCVFSFEP